MPLHIEIETELGRAPGGMLSSRAMAELAPAFAAFRQKTGVAMSEYDDTQLPPNHAGLLADTILTTCGQHAPPDIAAFQALLRKASAAGRYLDCSGE